VRKLDCFFEAAQANRKIYDIAWVDMGCWQRQESRFALAVHKNYTALKFSFGCKMEISGGTVAFMF
jgi:hypothetical protein